MEESELSHLFVLCAWLAIIGIRMDADAASWQEETCYLDVLRFHKADEVLHNNVDAILVETAVIAEAEEVELKAFALHHSLVGQVTDANLCEVGLSCDGA